MKKVLGIILMLMSFVAYGAPTTLKVWIMPNSAAPKADLEKITADYTKKTGVKVEVTVLDWGSAWTKITTAATSGIGPDVIQLGTTWVPTLAAMDALVDLKSSIPAGTEKTFIPAAYAYSKMVGSQEVVTLPWFSDVRPFYYRKDVFKAAGLDPKQVFASWDNLKTATKKIQGIKIDGKAIAPIGFPGKNDWNVPHFMAPFIWGAGGDFLSKDGKNVLIASDKSVKGIEFYASFVLEGLMPKKYLEKNSSEVESKFRAGEIAIFSTGPWITKDIDKAVAGKGNKGEVLDKVGVALPPAGPSGRYTFFGGSSLGVFKSTKYQKEAIELVKYLTTNVAAASAYAEVTGNYPPLLAAANTSYVTKNEGRSVIKEATKFGKAYTVVPTWGPMETILSKRLGAVWDIVAGVSKPYNKADMVNELKAAEKEMKTIINQMQ